MNNDMTECLEDLPLHISYIEDAIVRPYAYQVVTLDILI